MPTLELNPDERIRRKARSTGTTVGLVDCGKDHPDGPWTIVCEDHRGCMHHQTRKLAEGWLSHPEDWCPDCMEAAKAKVGG